MAPILAAAQEEPCGTFLYLFLCSTLMISEPPNENFACID